MKILVFAPHAGIWTHAFPEALIAESLQKRGHEIIYVTCEQTFQGFCTVMAAFGYNNDFSEQEKNQACRKCKNFSKLIVEQFGFTHQVIKDYLNENDYVEITSKLSKITKDNLLDFSVDEIEIGRLTLYQILLEYKKNTLTFSEKEWERVVVDLNNSLRTFYAARKILAQEKPDAVILYNSLYSVNHIFSKLAEQNNIKQYFLHTGGNLATRLETMILGESDGFKYYHHLLNKWHDYKHIPCTENLIKKVSAHLLSVIKGSTVFSYSEGVSLEQVDIRKFFNISQDQKIILATMSSNDERYAATIVKAYSQSDQVLFPDQFVWLEQVIEYVKQRPDLFLIIRVHPREVPNRRESVVSENYSRIQDLFSELPTNVKVNWPEQKISLYHLAQETDLCLNSWSSAGKEMTAFGIPVLIYSEEIQVYPPDLNYVGKSKEDYFTLFEQILAKGWDFERIRKVFRWYAFEYFRTTLDLSDSIDINPKVTNRYYRKILRLINPVAMEKIDCNRRKPQLKAHEIIGNIIENKNSSILDILENIPAETTSIDNETEYLSKYLTEIFNVLMKSNTKATPLFKHFNAFKKAKEIQYA